MGYSLFLLSFNGTSIRDFITRQTYVVIMRFWRDMGYVAFAANQVLSRIRAFLDLFCPDFYSDIEHFTHILCRHMPKKLAAKTSVNTLQPCVQDIDWKGSRKHEKVQI